MASALKAVQKAIYDVLKADASLMTLLTNRLYDSGNVPDDTEFPYLVIGEVTEIPDNTLDKRGKRVGLLLHAWSIYAGKDQVYGVLDRLEALLDYQPLTVVGHNVVWCRLTQAQPAEALPGLLHLRAEFQVRTHE